MIIDNINVIGIHDNAKKVMMHWLEETDIISFVNEIVITTHRDCMIYGYNPWDYLEETKLNMKEQGFLK